MNSDDYTNMTVESAERLDDVTRPEPTSEDIEQATDELRDEIIAGGIRGGLNLRACLDCEFNSDGYTGTVNDLAALVLGLYSEGTSATWLGVLALAEKIVERHLPEQAIAERAQRIITDRGEESCT